MTTSDQPPPENAGTPATALDGSAIKERLAGLTGWKMSGPGDRITRRFEFKDFAKAVEMANLAAWLGNKQNHHPDIAFGWGYCEVTFTTHDMGGLTEADFACASRLDALVA